MQPCYLLVEKKWADLYLCVMESFSSATLRQEFLKCIHSWPIRLTCCVPACVYMLSMMLSACASIKISSIFRRFMQTFHRNTRNPLPSHAASQTLFFYPTPQRYKSTIRRVPTQSALLFSPATPLRPASCKSSTANWEVRGPQQPRISTNPQNIEL